MIQHGRLNRKDGAGSNDGGEQFLLQDTRRNARVGLTIFELSLFSLTDFDKNMFEGITSK